MMMMKTEDTRVREAVSKLLDDAVPREPQRTRNWKLAVAISAAAGALTLALVSAKATGALECATNACLMTQGVRIPLQETIDILNSCLRLEAIHIGRLSTDEILRASAGKTSQNPTTLAWAAYQRLMESRLPFDRETATYESIALACLSFRLDFRTPGQWGW